MCGMEASTSPTDTAIRFEAQVLELNEQLLVRLPEPASAELPSRGQVAVTGTLNDEPMATVIEPDGMRGHWMRLAELAAPGSVAAGDTVRVTLTPAPEWPEPVVPDDLQAALDAAPDLAELWRTITPMARWEWVRWVGATKNPATRAKRVDVSIDKMRNGKRRPCCFDLSACTDPQVARSGKLIAAN